MNKIGIIFAMKEELDALLKKLELKNEYKIFDLTFYECTYLNHECILVESGIGKVNAARCCQILIDNMNVDMIFNIGIAGGVDKDLRICDVVIGEKLVQHDFDLTAFNHEKGFIPSVGKYIDADTYLLSIASQTLNNIKAINVVRGVIDCDDYLVKTASSLNIDNIEIRKGVIASGDIFCTESWMSEKINKKFKALCVEMEGAAIAQVCYLSHIPFLVIRSISDSPNNDNNKMEYDEFITKSCDIVANIMINILQKIQN